MISAADANRIIRIEQRLDALCDLAGALGPLVERVEDLEKQVASLEKQLASLSGRVGAMVAHRNRQPDAA